ncbi:TPA: hypothetical protein GRI80_14880 [Vibrio parahaemolyticus]|uniref:hypothetical protein n=1 Tax=Vibrio parahaemolyticus TaxID=670 RepID=UPI000B78266F|nr:hypothetical protein [Vibrio parahaemolyticus]AWA88765.1 hypothetical protein BSG32_06780 [Vibrio parahaemolyticus]EJX1250793.1 hypothetical protein [Vibrio parahaemolyticus]OXD88578.1 hypothetical protein BSG35_09910 [Vibrio parahaemolyticus]OXE00181.1 hypothetical protein BSG33_00500 [Vibrio parahaemolyticus]HAS6749301.1 hypothetical protein [Vibrio parahaemolyticus]
MYKTPRFFTVIDEVSQVLCLNEGKTRKRVLSESRTFDNKRVYFSDFLSQLSKVLNCEKSEVIYITEVFLKVENILSDLANTPIYSNVSSEKVERFFYSKYTSFFIIFLVRELSLKFKKPLYDNLNEILSSHDFNEIDRNYFINYFKVKFSDYLRKIVFNKDVISEFSIFISKLDKRSFPKIKTIEELLSECFPPDESGNNEKVKRNIHSFFIASKIAFNISKINELYIEPKYLSQGNEVKLFLEKYVFNDIIDQNNHEYLNDEYYKSIKSGLLAFIGQQDPVEFLKKHSTPDLWKYDNQVFLSYCVREGLHHYINKFFVDYDVIKAYEKYLYDIKNRQCGEDGTYIAIFLITSALKLKKKLPQNYLQPYVSLLYDNLRIENIEYQVCYSPFGFIDLDGLSIYEINLAYAIRSFNDLVKKKITKTYYCNPLYNLDGLIEKIMLGKNLTANDLKIKPIKGFNETLFDALVKIDFYVLSFGLQKNIGTDHYGRAYVKESIAGNWINKFIQLSEVERKSILRSLSPEEYEVLISNQIDPRSICP